MSDRQLPALSCPSIASIARPVRAGLVWHGPRYPTPIDYAEDRPRQSPSAMTPLTISILLLVCAFVITVAYVAVDEHS